MSSHPEALRTQPDPKSGLATVSSSDAGYWAACTSMLVHEQQGLAREIVADFAVLGRQKPCISRRKRFTLSCKG